MQSFKSTIKTKLFEAWKNLSQLCIFVYIIYIFQNVRIEFQKHWLTCSRLQSKWKTKVSKWRTLKSKLPNMLPHPTMFLSHRIGGLQNTCDKFSLFFAKRHCTNPSCELQPKLTLLIPWLQRTLVNVQL